MYHSSLERVRGRVPIRVVWRAFELNPREAAVTPEQEAAKEAYIAQAWPGVQKMAREVYGLELERGPRGVDTRMAHVGMVVARRFQKEEAYLQQVFAAYWKDGEDVGDPAVLERAAGAAGIPVEAFRAGLDDEGLLREVLAEIEEAYRLGIRGVPATILDGRYKLSGCRPADELEHIFRQVMEQGR